MLNRKVVLAKKTRLVEKDVIKIRLFENKKGDFANHLFLSSSRYIRDNLKTGIHRSGTEIEFGGFHFC